MIYLFCGIIIGIVMGLTGAGGALIAIPLFIHFLDMSLKEASVYSLIAVLVASFLNFFAQRKLVQYRAGIIIVIASALSSYLTAPFKEALPTIYISIILSAVSLYALYGVWKTESAGTSEDDVSQNNFIMSLLVGLLLGVLTTFTGLGGGVLMLPIFLTLYHYSVSQAVATSIFSVGLSSLASFLIQLLQGAKFKGITDLIYLSVGTLLSVLIIKVLLRYLSKKVLTQVRKVVFTLVVMIALLKIF